MFKDATFFFQASLFSLGMALFLVLANSRSPWVDFCCIYHTTDSLYFEEPGIVGGLKCVRSADLNTLIVDVILESAASSRQWGYNSWTVSSIFTCANLENMFTRSLKVELFSLAFHIRDSIHDLQAICKVLGWIITAWNKLPVSAGSYYPQSGQSYGGKNVKVTLRSRAEERCFPKHFNQMVLYITNIFHHVCKWS